MFAFHKHLSFVDFRTKSTETQKFKQIACLLSGLCLLIIVVAQTTSAREHDIRRYTGRGYDGGTVLSAERGWLWCNELSSALGNSGQALYAGVNTGRVGAPPASYLLPRL